MYGGIGGGLLLVIIAFAFMIKSGVFEKAKNVRKKCCKILPFQKLAPSATRGYEKMDEELGLSESEDEFLNKLRLTPQPLPKDY